MAQTCGTHDSPQVAHPFDSCHGAPPIRCNEIWRWLQFASHIRAKLDSAQAPVLVIRCDVQNAFGAIHRTDVLSAASKVDPLLSKTLAPWRCRSSGVALLSAPLFREFLQTNRGIPQGDPLSSVLFSLTFSQALTCLDATDSRPSLGTLDAYADDAILSTTPSDAGPAFLRWRDRLAELGLELNPAKTAVWQPDASGLPASLSPFLPASCFTSSGLTLCGLPLDASTDPLRFDLPLGDSSFLHSFLSHQLVVLRNRLSMLEAFVDFHGPASPALHLALTLLRCNIQHSWAHLWRFLPPPLAQPHAALIDELLMQHFTRLTAIPTTMPLTRDILNYPLAQGGLNLLQHCIEAHIHFFSGAMALQLNADSPLGVARVEPAHVTLSFEALSAFLPQPPDRILADVAPAHYARKLRESLYAALGEALRKDCPWLQPTVTHLPPEIPKPVFMQMRWATAWWTARAPCLLPAAPLVLALRRHLGLPVLAADQLCGYAPLTTGRVCSARLGEFSSHVHTCAQGPRQHRHNALAHVWRGILREAQYHTQVEQNVLLSDVTCRKADITALHASGHHLALDVMVTGNPNPSQPAATHLSNQERGKAARYGSRPNGSLPGGILCVPLLHLSGDLFLGSSALIFLHKLCLSTARASAPLIPLPGELTLPPFSSASVKHWPPLCASTTSACTCHAVVSCSLARALPGPARLDLGSPSCVSCFHVVCSWQHRSCCLKGHQLR